MGVTNLSGSGVSESSCTNHSATRKFKRYTRCQPTYQQNSLQRPLQKALMTHETICKVGVLVDFQKNRWMRLAHQTLQSLQPDKTLG